MSILIHFNDEAVRSEINKDVRATTGASALNAFVKDHGQGVLEMLFECVPNIMLFQFELAWNVCVRVKDAVATETVGVETVLFINEDVFAVLTGAFWCTRGTHITSYRMRADLMALASDATKT